MRALETRVPPPVVTLVIAAVMWALARLTASAGVTSSGLRVVGLVVACVGLALEVAAALTFRRVCTTVNPLNPAAATALVSGGVYRFSRNPIYVGDLLVLIGWAAYLGSIVALAVTPAFVLYINRFQIMPEERILEEKFGQSYQRFRSRVRRWI